jgi:hypothetical protein
LTNEALCLAQPYDSADGEHLSVHGYEAIRTIIYNDVVRDILTRMQQDQNI